MIALYETERPKIQTGDVLLCAGTTFVSRLIRNVTESEYSHVVMVRRDHNRLMCFESSIHGTVYIPVSDLIHRGYEYIDVFRIPNLNKDAAISYLLDNLGKKYDYEAGAEIWWERTFPKLANILDPNISYEDLDEYICSAYISGASEAGGVDPSPDQTKVTVPKAFSLPPMQKITRYK